MNRCSRSVAPFSVPTAHASQRRESLASPTAMPIAKLCLRVFGEHGGDLRNSLVEHSPPAFVVVHEPCVVR